MARYIDADKLLNNLPNDLPYKASVKRVLIQAPTTDVEEVKHGEWKQGVPYVCSICGKPASDEKNTDEKYSCWLSPYCPHCGAKMSVNYKSSKNER
jgi:DNA-directed RNA polymerase subunit RPC12/RpoP